jgi:hypothetical protein
MAPPMYALMWQDVAWVMVETDSLEGAAHLPTDMLIETLNTVQDRLEYLDWYGNIQNSLRLVDKVPQQLEPDYTEDGHLEAEFEDRESGK